MTSTHPQTRARTRMAVAEHPQPYAAAPASGFPEATLTALWLLGRVPQSARDTLPYRLLQPGHAGRGPGPDVRDAAFLAPSGATLAGDVEVHLRASDFARHGHATDPAYAGVVLHLCWVDDRPYPGTATPLPGPDGTPGARSAPTVALSSVLAEREVERLVALGPDLAVASPPCAAEGARGGSDEVARLTEVTRLTQITQRVRAEGRRRLAERTWRAWRLADRYGFEGALRMLLERAVASTAGRVRESDERRSEIVAGILAGLGDDPVEALADHAREGRASLVEALRGGELGAVRGAEVAWNVALPLVAALAAAYDDVPLARASAALADGWPAPRPYGRTRALTAALSGDAGTPRGAGALYAQGLLHLQDLWCSRGGCGACPLSAPAEVVGVEK